MINHLRGLVLAHGWVSRWTSYVLTILSVSVTFPVPIALLGFLPGYRRWPLYFPYLQWSESQRGSPPLILWYLPYSWSLWHPEDASYIPTLVSSDFHPFSWSSAHFFCPSKHLILNSLIPFPILSSTSSFPPSTSYDYFVTPHLCFPSCLASLGLWSAWFVSVFYD